MKPKYDVLVVDLDGTLLHSNGRVSPRNQQAIRNAREAGMTVIVATGRALVECRHTLGELGHDGLVVCAGGSQLCDASTGATIDRRVMDAALVHEVSQQLLADGHRVLVLKDGHAAGFDYLLIGDGPLDAASRWWFAQLPVRLKETPAVADDPAPDDTLRAAAVACRTRLEPLARNLQSCLGERAMLQHWPAVTETHAIGATTHLLEVFCAGVNKWTMIESFCRSSEIDVARVAAIGDGLNDVELVRHAGLGIAMGNAIPGVKDVADRIAGHHDQDGAADAIERVLRGEW